MNTGDENRYNAELYPGSYEKFKCIERLIHDNRVGMAIISVPDIVMLKTNQMYITDLEEPYNRVEYITGKSLRDIDGPWSNQTDDKSIGEFIKKRKTKYLNEIKITTKNGEDKYYNNILSPIDEDGEVRYILSVLMDVTRIVKNRQKTEAAAKTIQLEKQELEAVIDNLSDAILVLKDGRLYLQNKAFKSYFGGHKIKDPKDIYDSASFYNRQGERLTYERMPLRRMLNGERFVKEDVLMDRNGDLKYLTITGTTLADKEDRPYLHIISCRDATDRAQSYLTAEKQKKQLDQELKAERCRAEILKMKMQENETFLSFISHEFRTPLTVINAAVQALDFCCRGELPQKAEKYLNSIQQNTYRLLRLMNNILDLNRAEEGFLKTHSVITDVIDLTRSIVDSVTVYGKQKNVKIHFSSRCKVMKAVLDQMKYERILLNLLSNAVKFTPSGRSIYVSITCRNGYFYLKVRDEGVGIPIAKQKVLFNRYSQVSNDLTRPSEGAGIGLSLVKQLVKSMNGSIALESYEGKGSTFIIELPAEKPKDIGMTASTEIREISLEEAVRIEFS